MKKISIVLSILILSVCALKAKDKPYCTSGNCKNGYGTVIFLDDTVYRGYFKKGKFHGKGTMYYHKLKKVGKGTWKKGKIWKGYAIVVSPTKDVYMGYFKKGKFHGEGVFVSKSGKYYKGKFKKGRYYGCGSFHKANDELIAKGCWEDGEFEEDKDEEEDTNY